MSLGAGALKVKGPVAQKGSVALEVATQHSHTEEKFSGILTTTHIYLSRGEGGAGAKPAAITICE